MTYALSILVALLVVALVLRERDHDRVQTALIEHQEAERAELLTRIQRPELVHPRMPVAPPRQRTAAERAADKALSQIGTVAVAPEKPADA